MSTKFYLVESIQGSEFNIYTGSEKGCNTEMQRIIAKLGDRANPMYVTSNKFN